MCAIIPQSVQSIANIIDNMEYYIDSINEGLGWVNNKIGANLTVESITHMDEQ